MRRLLVCLSLAPVLLICLAIVLVLVWLRDSPAEFDTLTPLAAPSDPGQPEDIPLEHPRALAFVVGLSVTQAKLPLPDDAIMEQLAKTSPIAFIKYCLRRYDYTVQGYELTFKKQERIGGKLQPSETIAVQFREQPFSVLFDWLKGERLAKKALFVRGENENKLLVRPAGVLSLAGIRERDPEGEQAKQSGRYPLSEFGLKIGTLRTIAACEMARKNKALHMEYLGQKRIPEVGDRVCYVLRRAPYEKPEEDGIVSATYYFDKETWLQVGSTLKNADGELIAEYWFRDIKLNPSFKPDTFTRKSVK